MTSYSFTLLSKINKIGEKTIAIVIVKDRKNTSLSIRQSCKEEDWSYDTMRVKNKGRNARAINDFIDKYGKITKEIIERFELGDHPYSMSDVITAIKHHEDKKVRKVVTYTDYCQSYMTELSDIGKLSTRGTQFDTLRRLQEFFGKKQIMFQDFTYNSMNEFYKFLQERKNSSATIAMRFRSIRRNFTQAIREGVILQSSYPFEKFKISKIDRTAERGTKKEILMKEQIALLKDYIPQSTKEIWAKDMFLLSYFARGINFIDLMLLKKSDLVGKHISYIRRKTGVLVTFEVTDEIKKLFLYYSASPESKYLLNFILRESFTETYLKNKKHKRLAEINNGLLLIMKTLGIERHITYYCARHSFATVLKFHNVSVEIIKEALGHLDIKSTMSYLARLPDKKLDMVIEDVIN